MLNDSSNTPDTAPESTATAVVSAGQASKLSAKRVPESKRKRPSYWLLLGLPLWTLASFIIGQLLVVGLLWAVDQAGVSLADMNSAIFGASVAALSYGFSLMVAIGAPWLIRRRRTTLVTMGMQRSVQLLDIVSAPVAAVVYLIMSGILVYIVSVLAPGFDLTQQQEIGFSGLTHNYEYVFAFIALVVLAPVAEEMLFRGYLYGKLRRVASSWWTILIVSLLFAALHLPAEQLQWNVAVDVFALSIVLCFLREKTGSIWAGVLLHMMKNGLAFYLLFINTDLLRTMGM